MTYNKPLTFIAEKIDLLAKRGMVMPPDSAHFLTHVNYYRLREYWQHLKIDKTLPQGGRRFRKGANFQQVISCYNFDCKLQLLLLEAIKYIEISVRTQWVYHIAHNGGAFAHLSADLFTSIKNHQDLIQYYKSKNDLSLPIWAAAEVMSLGSLSKWYKNTALHIRQKVAKIHDMDEELMVSFLHSLVDIRNRCAHHNRLWDKNLASMVIQPQKKQRYLRVLYNENEPKKIYNMLFRIVYLLDIISPANDWKLRLLSLLNEYNNEYNNECATGVGFPDKWRQMTFWQKG